MLDYMTCSTCFYYSASKGLCVRYPPQMAQAQPDLDPRSGTSPRSRPTTPAAYGPSSRNRPRAASREK